MRSTPRGHDKPAAETARRRKGASVQGTPDAAAARRVAADLLSRRPWTRVDLTARLRRRGATEAVAAEVVADLTARGDLDDARFARQWVEARSGRGYGPARLAAELRARGVAAALVKAALAALDPDGELERARAAARRRLPALGGAPPARAASRLRDHLMRRGFGAEAVARVVRELVRVEGGHGADVGHARSDE